MISPDFGIGLGGEVWRFSDRIRYSSSRNNAPARTRTLPTAWVDTVARMKGVELECIPASAEIKGA